jgi:hypothetical protein
MPKLKQVGSGRVYRNGHVINTRYEVMFPRNCPVVEQTADGAFVGTCTFFLKDGKTCERHGNVKEDKK